MGDGNAINIFLISKTDAEGDNGAFFSDRGGNIGSGIDDDLNVHDNSPLNFYGKDVEISTFGIITATC
jgi:hypothetical protein